MEFLIHHTGMEVSICAFICFSIYLEFSLCASFISKWIQVHQGDSFVS